MPIGPFIALFAMVAAVTIMAVVLHSRPKPPRRPADQGPLPEQAVIVYLDSTLAREVYSESDLAALENSLSDIIERDELGQYDGNEVGPAGITLFMYGADAEHLFAGIEKTLRDCTLCTGARVVIRRGASGAPQRELRL